MAKVFTITEGLENMGALSTGGQGSVYKGKRMGAMISAVKLLPTPIHTENTDDKNFRDFQNEVEKLKKVNEDPNPNVVKIINSGLTESGSFPFIEMEFIEGPDLEALLRKPHDPIFTIRETIKLATHLSNALAHCHRAGVKHGDIKSNNVKFNTDTGNYILLDFGLAVMSDEQRRSSLRHAGAVEFMAPEQHDGEMLFQSDIYSFGIILYELLAGVVPFPLMSKGESNRNQVMISHVEKPVPDLMELRFGRMPKEWPEGKILDEMSVPLWLLEIVNRCLQKVPESRYKNGVELHDAVCNQGGGDKTERIATPVYQSAVKSGADMVLLQEENNLLAIEVERYRTYFRNKVVLFIVTMVLVCAITLAFSSNWGSETETLTTADSVSTVKKDSLNTARLKATEGANKTKKVPKKAPKKTKDGLINDVPEF
ncbi:MAG: serine/threonine-protein kinase [Bacteroidota bacterium]